MARMKQDELESLLSRAQATSIGALNGTIGKHRADLLDRYFAEPYGDEVDGRTKIVDTSIRDVIESIKPELMDIFYGGDKVVQFEPEGAEDVEAAEQETDVCNYILDRKNDGFITLYNWFTDALMLKTGYVKRYWDDREVIEVEEYDELDPQELAAIFRDLESRGAEIEVTERWENTTEQSEVVPLEMLPPELPEGIEVEDQGDGTVKVSQEVVESIGVKLKITRRIQEYKIVNVPPEEIYVHPQWTRLDFDGCPYVAHGGPRVVSDLVEMGFSRKQLADLPDHDGTLDKEEAENRYDGEYFQENSLSQSPDESMREVMVYENYIRADRNGDGKAELLRIWSGHDGEILKRDGKPAIEEVDAAPFNVLCPMPIPHKHFGLSVAELVQDLQRLKTVLTRQMMDNIIINNYPDIVVDSEYADEQTYTDLAVESPGRTLRARGGANTITWQAPPQISGESLQAIDYVDRLKELRTGVSDTSQGLNADSLKADSGMAVSKLISVAQKKVLLIARIFAETGVKDLFLDMHRDLRKGPLKSIAVRLNNEWVSVNPRTWKERADMTVSVGLGTGDRDKQMMILEGILGQQKEAMAQGFAGYEHLHHTYSKLLEIGGFKDVASFFADPEQVAQMKAQQPQQPDPNVILAQAEMEKAKADMAKVQTDMQRFQVDAQLRGMDLKMKEIDLQIAQAKLEYEREQKKNTEDTRRLDIMMKDDRERDLAAAKIEADEAERKEQNVNGPELTHD